jgi:hypothetical protein
MHVYMDSEVIPIEEELGASNFQKNYWEEPPSASWNILEPLSVRGWTLWKDKWNQKQAYCLKATMASAATPAETAAADLAMAAFFFACRSCQYTKVKGARRTKPIHVRDIQFRTGKTLLPHDSVDLHTAETVSVIFRDQKNRSKFQTRTAWTNDDKIANPVVAWANTVRRVGKTSKCRDSTEVYHFADLNGATTQAVSNDMLLVQL